MIVLETVNLKKYYGVEPNITKALDGINFTVEKGEFVAIVGTSGSGKSTLLNMIGGLDRPTSGIVKIQGKNLLELNDEQLTIFRRRNIGFIFQNYNLLPMLNVYENIVLPIELDGKSVDQEFLKEIISILGLEERINSMPNMLSGGQQQRVAIARALITKPAIILADEPTGNLDSRTSQDVLELIQNTSRRFEQTVVMITHNEHIAGLTERIVQIEDGKFLRTGLIGMKSTANKMVVKNIVRRNIQFEKRRNIMIIIAIALASFLICFSGLIVTSLMEVQKKQIQDTYEAVYMNVSEEKFFESKRRSRI